MAIVITKQPADFVCTVNETAIFTFEATGVTKYQWQCLGDSGHWNNLSWSGYNTATMTRALNMNNINYQYRCELTDADGNKMYTRTVRVIEPTDDIGGLVNASTLHAIAEAIRAKTETTDKILPADMAAMIEAITASSGINFLNGSFTPSGGGTTANLGATLPDSDNYVFVVRQTSISYTARAYTLLWAMIVCVDGELTRSSMWLEYASSLGVYKDKFTVAINGDTMSQTGGAMFAGAHEWWYAYG